MLIHDHLSVSIAEPGSSAVSSRFIQDRDFFAFRNTRQILHHRPAGSPLHDLVMESYVQLRSYHLEHHRYNISLRQTYNVKTFATFVGIVNDLDEPFVSVSNMLDYRPFALAKVPSDQASLRGQWQGSELNLFKSGTPQHLRFDCIAHNPENSSAAIVTSTPGQLTVQFLKDLLTQCHYAYFYFNTGKDDAFNAQWYRIFNTRSRQVRLYVGVGGNEFGEAGSSCSVVPPPLVETHPLVTMARQAAAATTAQLSSVAKSVEFARQAQMLVPADARAFAARYGIRILVRYNMRYFMLR